MEENRKRKYMLIIGPLVLLITLIGVTYAFFNYTRTGTANSLRTGNIYFNSDQNNTLNITNIFPMTSTEAGNAQLDSVTVGIVGSTSYVDGEEFEITLVGVNNTINGKEVPMNYIATYTATTGNTVGTSSNNYFSARDSKNANIYTLNATGEVKEGKQVLVGYVDNEGNGINGTLTIKAYIDADRIAISDTYYRNTPNPTPAVTSTPGGIVSTTEDLSKIHLSKLNLSTPTPMPTPTPTPGPNDEYGTTTEWVHGRTVLTTEEWNSLASNPISFKIKAESQEGIWVKEPGKIESCPDCKFMYYVVNGNNDPLYTTWNMAGYDEVNQVEIPETPTVITEGLYDDYEELISTTGKNYFLGVKLNSSNQVTNAYACGVKNDVPFCIEGTLDSELGGTQNATTYSTNQTLLQGASLYNNTCSEFFDINTEFGYDYIECGSWNNTPSISAYAESSGSVNAGVGDFDRCFVDRNGSFGCYVSGGFGPVPGGGTDSKV